VTGRAGSRTCSRRYLPSLLSPLSMRVKTKLLPLGVLFVVSSTRVSARQLCAFSLNPNWQVKSGI
jgi:hypothetical protein